MVNWYIDMVTFFCLIVTVQLNWCNACVFVCAEYYVALYPYQSMETGDLSFQQGEVILVGKKEGDWWTGTIGDRQGIFPSNYVQKAQTEVSKALSAIHMFQIQLKLKFHCHAMAFTRILLLQTSIW